MPDITYTCFGLARRSEKQYPLLSGRLLLKGCFKKGKTMQAKLCECGCGKKTPIAIRTCTSRGQKKGEPLRFINGHNARLLDSAEQKRRVSLRDYASQRYTGSRKNYVKLKNRHMHRVVAEQKLGRKLASGEIVHHIDGDKWNNHPNNLLVMTQAEHARIHCNIRWHGVPHD
jgi:hypothetical protein